VLGGDITARRADNKRTVSWGAIKGQRKKRVKGAKQATGGPHAMRGYQLKTIFERGKAVAK